MISRELWSLGHTIATGFIDSKASLIYIGHDDNPFGGVIVSVEDLAAIIVGHQKRRRLVKQETNSA